MASGAAAASASAGSVPETRSRAQHGPFRDTAVLICGFAPPERDALVGAVQALGGNTQTRFRANALPHVVVCGTTADDNFRVSCFFSCAVVAV